MANVVLKVSENTRKKMIKYYEDKKRDKKIPYVVFQAQDLDTVITMYESGKVMFQGVSADIDANMWREIDGQSKKKEENTKDYEKYYYSSSIGSDEVGTGDYFGPIVVTSTYVSKNDIDLINNQKEILPKKKHKIFIDGEAQGVLWGGNLSTIVSLFGSCNYLPDKEIILFLEDINEPLYKIDKMLIQIFRNLQLKNKIKGIVFGEFLGLKKEEEKQLENLLFEYSKMLNIPCVYGYDITHGKNNVTLPFGRCAKLLGAKICLL